MNKTKSLSIQAGATVDLETGEVEKIRGHISVSKQTTLSESMTSKYSQKAIDEARKTTSDLCEKCVLSLVGGKTTIKGNNKGYDLTTHDGIKLEAKMGRIGKHAVIKMDQLNELDEEGIYGILFYRTTNNKVPSYFTSKPGLKISPQEHLLRNISIKELFIFPRDVMTLRYNTAKICEGIISTTGIRHKALPYARAKGLFAENPSGEDAYISKTSFGRHTIDISSLGYQI